MSPRLPTCTAQELVKFLKRQGFVEDRQRGSHLVLFHPEDNEGDIRINAQRSTLNFQRKTS